MWMGLRGALGSRYPGADIHLEGAVPVGAVVPVNGPQPAKAGREGKAKPTAVAAPSWFVFADARGRHANPYARRLDWLGLPCSRAGWVGGRREDR